MPYGNIELLQKDWGSFSENKNMSLNEDISFCSYNNSAVYSPFSYIPQTFGILFGRLITDNIVTIFYFGRFFNFVFISFLLYISLKILPFGKESTIIFLLMPMNIFEAFSLSPDGIVVAIGFLIVSLSMNLRVKYVNKMKWYHVLVLYLAGIMISMVKIVYIPFLLFYILIPSDRFAKGLKEKIIHATSLGLIAVVLNGMWLNYCSRFLVYAGTDAKAQLTFVICHPFEYIIIFFRTIMEYGAYYALTMVGTQLGWLDVSTIGIFGLAYLVHLVCKFRICKDKKDKDFLKKIISALTILLIMFLSFTSLYLQWTFVYSRKIDGIQGRYFIPLLLPAYLLFSKDHYEEGKREEMSVFTQAIAIIINCCAGMKLLFTYL